MLNIWLRGGICGPGWEESIDAWSALLNSQREQRVWTPADQLDVFAGRRLLDLQTSERIPLAPTIACSWSCANGQAFAQGHITTIEHNL